MTVKKPGNGIKHENLQKSATTNSNTVQVSFNGPHFTPREKVANKYDADDFSEKFTPECSAAAAPMSAQNTANNAPSKKEAIEDDESAPVMSQTI